MSSNFLCCAHLSIHSDHDVGIQLFSRFTFIDFDTMLFQCGAYCLAMAAKSLRQFISSFAFFIFRDDLLNFLGA